MTEKLSPWQQGEQDARNGVSWKRCPFRAGSIEHRRYMGGYQDTLNKARKVQAQPQAQECHQ